MKKAGPNNPNNPNDSINNSNFNSPATPENTSMNILEALLTVGAGKGVSKIPLSLSPMPKLPLNNSLAQGLGKVSDFGVVESEEDKKVSSEQSGDNLQNDGNATIGIDEFLSTVNNSILSFIEETAGKGDVSELDALKEKLIAHQIVVSGLLEQIEDAKKSLSSQSSTEIHRPT